LLNDRTQNPLVEMMVLKMMKKVWILLFEQKESLLKEFEGGIKKEGNQESSQDRNNQQPNIDSPSPGG